MLFKKTGQGTIEYILLIAVCILVFLLFFQKNGIFAKHFNNMVTISAGDVVGVANAIF